MQGGADGWLRTAGLHHCQRRPVLRNHRRRLRQLAGLRNHLHQDRLDLQRQPVQGRAASLHAADLHDRQRRPVLRNHRRRLRQLAGLREHLQQERVDLRGQPVQRSASGLHPTHLHPGLRRPILRDHRRRLWQLAGLQHGLLGCWQRLGVRQPQRVCRRFDLPAADLCGIERGQLLWGHRGWLWRDARMQHDLPQGRLGVQQWPM